MLRDESPRVVLPLQFSEIRAEHDFVSTNQEDAP